MQEKKCSQQTTESKSAGFFLNAIERYQKHCKYNAFFEYGQQKKPPFRAVSQTIKKGENRDLRTILKFAEYYVCVWRTYDVRKNRGCETRSQPRKFNNKIQYGKTFIQIPTFQLRMYHFQCRLPLK